MVGTGTTISIPLLGLSKRRPHLRSSHQIIISRLWGPWRSHCHPSPLISYPLFVTCCCLESLIRPYSLNSVPNVQSLIVVNTDFHGAWVCICMYRVNKHGPTNRLCFPTALPWVFPFFLPPLLSIGYSLLLLLFLLLLVYPILFPNISIPKSPPPKKVV